MHKTVETGGVHTLVVAVLHGHDRWHLVFDDDSHTTLTIADFPCNRRLSISVNLLRCEIDRECTLGYVLRKRVFKGHRDSAVIVRLDCVDRFVALQSAFDCNRRGERNGDLFACDIFLRIVLHTKRKAVTLGNLCPILDNRPVVQNVDFDSRHNRCSLCRRRSEPRKAQAHNNR